MNSFFYKKKYVPKSLFVCSEPESSRAIFESKKNEKKRAKNTFPVYGWASKSLKNHAFFIKNNHHLLLENSLLLSFPGIQMEHKNHSFLTSKFMYFYVKNHCFHRSTYVDAGKNSQKNMYFHWKNHIFFIKIIVFSKKNKCFHTSPYIDDHEKTCKKSSYFCSKLIFFD